MAMKWRNAVGVKRDGETWPIPDALDSDKGYRIIRQKVFRNGYRYSAWQPAPELLYPSLKLLSIHDTSDAAKAACEEHLKQAQ